MPIILLALPYLCHTRDVFIPLLYHPIRGLLHFVAYMLSPYHVLHKSPKTYIYYIATVSYIATTQRLKHFLRLCIDLMNLTVCISNTCAPKALLVRTLLYLLYSSRVLGVQLSTAAKQL